MLTLSRMYSHKNIRLHAKNYLGQVAVFVTLCCYDRRSHFGAPPFCLTTIEILRDAATTRSFAVHAYCFMPDHLHLLVEGLDGESDFLNFIKTFVATFHAIERFAPLAEEILRPHLALVRVNRFRRALHLAKPSPRRIGGELRRIPVRRFIH